MELPRLFALEQFEGGLSYGSNSRLYSLVAALARVVMQLNSRYAASPYFLLLASSKFTDSSAMIWHNHALSSYILARPISRTPNCDC